VKQFPPYYRHLLAVKWPFIAGAGCGLIYAVASGFGLPLMSKVVFPVLFNAHSIADAALGSAYEHWSRGVLGGISRNRLLSVTTFS